MSELRTRSEPRHRREHRKLRGRRRDGLPAALIAALLFGCPEPEPERETIELGAVREVASADPAGERCYDVDSRRVCYGEAPHVVPPIALEAAPPDAMWRCEEERCALVRRRPFSSDDGVCRQRYPRVPDDADWECADVDGLVVCRDRAAPAGMVPGPRELGWICSEGAPRICIDPSPDRPGAGSHECRFVHEPVLERVCRARSTPILGSACRGRCPRGMTCLEGACAPSAIDVPDCWTDADCDRGKRCVLARCSQA